MKRLRPIRDLTPGELKEWLVETGQPAFRLKQLGNWAYDKLAIDFESMGNLPQALRGKLAESFLPISLAATKVEQSTDGTTKWLFQLMDGETIETVLIRAPGRNTLCISTQVGCPVRCVFCASGRDGLIRDLSVGEIVDQVVHATRELGSRPDNIVVMGMGEPLLNMNHLVLALETICRQDGMGLGFGARHITISTSGIVPGILHLAELGRPWNLALSLHATTDAGRAKLIPPKFRHSLDDVLGACRRYRECTGRIVTLEYALFAGENDSSENLRQLADIALSLDAKINLIPCNPTETPHAAPSEEAVSQALESLQDRGVKATRRRRKGAEIQAACGQLRRRTG
ncbi:MAG: 23S rRNA (adenine(2503)-C(2))-methyltransferase RlmN [Lentisphaeria bacterium]|nr:23S rRNA (adenine(2503)-C(2))-methyltransferase RlmN [Lentisphaeria bacterium]